MNLSFLRFFKKDTAPVAANGGVEVATQRAVAVEKPASERFSKTFTPNSSRVVGASPAQNFSVPAPLASAAPTGGPRKISLGGSVGSAAVAASEASPERTIALPLSDLVPHIPGGMLAPAEIDPQHRVLLKAADLERGMAKGRPTVLLRAIYQQAPEFFSKTVDAADQTEVALPFSKVLEQLASLQLRPDQVAAPEVPEVETPFLKVTHEDSKRFGKSVAPVPKPPQIDPRLPLDAQPEVAPPAPDAIAESKAVKPIRLPVPETGNGTAAAAAPVRLEVPPASPPNAAKFSPNGAGVPATERVPASSGPSVPTPLPSPFAPPTPARIPFKISPPSNDLRAPLVPKVAQPVVRMEAPASVSTGPRVKLFLREVLRGIPPFQLSGPIEAVPAEAQIEFPFAIIEPQLSLGRILVSPTQFQAALPEEFRSLIKPEEAETPIALPLQEVLQNLPNESLQLRGDQEEMVIPEVFETPFSKKAAEDVDRFKVPARPIAKAPAAAAAETLAAAAAVVAGVGDPGPTRIAQAPEGKPPGAPISFAPATKPPGSPAAAPNLPGSATPATATIPAAKLPGSAPRATGRSALQVVLDTDDELDPKTIVAHASRLPGIKACAVVFSDGLSLAGNIPPDCELEALCAMAPSIMKRIGDQMIGSHLGALNALTLFCAKTPVSFFAHGNICLAALHANGEIARETRLRLNSTAQEMARMYAQPA